MEKKDTLTRILAIIGTIFAWFPLLAPVMFSVILFLQAGDFRFDYLMPAELFLFALAGGLLLLWAAFRARSQRNLIGWGLGIAIVMLVGGQALADVTGLASGETEPAGLPLALVLASLIIFIFALLAFAIGGILLLRDLFKAARSPSVIP